MRSASLANYFLDWKMEANNLSPETFLERQKKLVRFCCTGELSGPLGWDWKRISSNICHIPFLTAGSLKNCIITPADYIAVELYKRRMQITDSNANYLGYLPASMGFRIFRIAIKATLGAPETLSFIVFTKLLAEIARILDCDFYSETKPDENPATRLPHQDPVVSVNIQIPESYNGQVDRLMRIKSLRAPENKDQLPNYHEAEPDLSMVDFKNPRSKLHIQSKDSFFNEELSIPIQPPVSLELNVDNDFLKPVMTLT